MVAVAVAVVEVRVAVVEEGIVVVVAEGLDRSEDQEHCIHQIAEVVPGLRPPILRDPRGLVEGELEQGHLRIDLSPLRLGR